MLPWLPDIPVTLIHTSPISTEKHLPSPRSAHNSMCHLHNWLCLTSATARLSLTLVEATWVLEGLFLMSFPQDLSVLPHGECSLCKPSHPSQSSRTRDLWDPSLITESQNYTYIDIYIPQGTACGTTLKSIPSPGADQCQEHGCEHLPWVHMQGKHGTAGALSVSPLLRRASQETMLCTVSGKRQNLLLLFSSQNNFVLLSHRD